MGTRIYSIMMLNFLKLNNIFSPPARIRTGHVRTRYMCTFLQEQFLRPCKTMKATGKNGRFRHLENLKPSN